MASLSTYDKSATIASGAEIELNHLKTSDQKHQVHEVHVESSEHPVRQISAALGPKQFYLILGTVSIMLSVNGLDANVLGDAAPVIATKLNALPQISWIGAIAMISASTSVLPIGMLYRQFDPKFVLLGTLLVFIAGECLSGAARQFKMFVAGRILAGIALGSTAVAGFLVVGLICTNMKERAIYISSVVALYGVMLKIGPLISGALLKRSLDDWRWCFYLEIPILIIVAILTLCGFPRLRAKSGPDTDSQEPDRKVNRQGSRFRRLGQIVVASIIFGALTLCIVLPPILGGNTLSWTSAGMIVLYIMIPVLATIFSIWTYRCEESERLIPVELFVLNPSLRGISVVLFCAILTTFASTFFLPIFFQTAFGSSPIHSAVQILPLAMFGIISVIVVGKIAEKTGTYVPSCLIGSLLHLLSGGLFYMVTEHSSLWKVYVLEAVLGLGAGSLTAIGNVVAFDKVPSTKFAGIVAWMNYLLVLAAALGIGIQGALLNRELGQAVMVIQTTNRDFEFSADIVRVLTDTNTNPQARQILRMAIARSQQQASLMYLVSGFISFLASCTLRRERL